MDIAILSALVTLCILVALEIKFKFDKQKNMKRHFIYILFIILLILFVFIVLFTNFIKSGPSQEIARLLIMMVTAIIALMALWNTTRISNITINNTENNQKTTLVTGLLNNHYKMVEDKKNELEQLWADLEKYLKKDLYEYNEIKKILEKDLYSTQNFTKKVDEAVKKMEEKIDAKKKQDLLSNPFFKSLKNIGDINGQPKKIDHDRITLNLFEILDENNDFKVFYNKNLQELELIKPTNNNVIIEELKGDVLEEFVRFLNKQESCKNFISNEKSHFKEFEKRYEIINNIFIQHYRGTGHIFRNSYRIFKIINEEFKSDETKRRQYIGLLRSLYSDEFLLTLFYNSIYTDKGLGYTKILLRTDFFGNERELSNENFITHIDPGKMIFSMDKNVAIKLFTKSGYDRFEDQINTVLKESSRESNHNINIEDIDNKLLKKIIKSSFS